MDTYTEEVKSENFELLSDDLRAKIIRLSGKASINKSHQKLITLDERINDASKKPFTKNEIDYIKIYVLHRNIKTFFIKNKNIQTYEYVQVQFRGADEAPECLQSIVSTTHFDHSGRCCDFDITLSGSHHDYNTNDDQLVNRFGVDIIKNTHIMINNKLQADTVLPDIVFVFKLLLYRFNVLGCVDSLELARKYTLQYLDSIVDHFAEIEVSLPLLLYLWESAYLVDPRIDKPRILSRSMKFRSTKRSLTSKFSDEVHKRCSELYESLIKYISEMN